MGRLLHNRIGYSTLQNLPMLLGLKPKPWLGEMEKLLLEKLPHDENLRVKNGLPISQGVKSTSHSNVMSKTLFQTLSVNCVLSSSLKMLLGEEEGSACFIE